MLSEILKWFLILIAVVAFFWRFVFLRNPCREIPEGNNIISPADGKVIKIAKFSKGKIEIQKGKFGKFPVSTSEVGKSGNIVSIFMSPFNVHVNRAPIAGEIIYANHIPGKFYKAFDFKKSMENERTEILIKSGSFRIKMMQVAGFVARRIEFFKKPGDNVKKGQVIGLINLGSQVTIILPEKVKIKVSEGQKVLAGETILGEYNQ